MPRPFGEPQKHVLDAGTLHEPRRERFAVLVLAFYPPVQMEWSELVTLGVRRSPDVDVFRRFLVRAQAVREVLLHVGRLRFDDRGLALESASFAINAVHFLHLMQSPG